jgi:N utilization substance protein B
MDRKEKRKARIITLQMIYAYESSNTNSRKMAAHLAKELNLQINSSIIKYSIMLADLAIEHALEIDKIIITHSKNWDFDRIAMIDRLILRISLAEMIYVEEVPHKVSISEGVEIAKEFSTEDSGSFVNGILDAVYNDIMKGKVA